MKKAIKNFLKSTGLLGKIFATLTLCILAFTAIVPDASAYRFWRAQYPNIYTQWNIVDPYDFGYGYGYGPFGWAWGYGYGYGWSDTSDEKGYYDNDSVDPNDVLITGTPPDLVSSITMRRLVPLTPGGGIMAFLPQGLVITPADGLFNPLTILANFGDLVNSDLDVEGTITGQVDFGALGEKLLFSVPVPVVIPAPYPDGTSFSLRVRHHGEGFTTGSLTTDPNATCDGSGNATPSMSTAIVSGGQVVFYTCSASKIIVYSTGVIGAPAPAAPGGGPPGGGGIICGNGLKSPDEECDDGNKVSGDGCSKTCKLEEDGSSPIDEFVADITTVFQDITGHWAESYILRIADLGIVQGKSPTRFAPNDYITRAELTKIALKAFNHSVVPTVGHTGFVDVSTASWYAPYIVAAHNAGIVQGYENNIFSPNGFVNRAEALKILFEAVGFTGVEENYQANYASKAGWTHVFFPDVNIGEWFAKYVAYAKDYGIVGGYADGTFGPGNLITRAEVAKIVVKMIDM